MKRYFLLFLVTTLVLSVFSLSVFSEETSTEENSVKPETSEATSNSEAEQSSDNADTNKAKYTISYGKGLYLTYNGKEPNNFIKGTPPASQTVEEGGSIVVASNTFTFRDYTFGGWKYTYKDASGNKKSKYYSQGDTISNITCNMKLEATWVKCDKDLKIDAYLVYANSNEKSNHIVGEITVLGNAPKAPYSNYEFCGWSDNDGTVLYQPGDSYEIKYINTVIKPVWSVDGQQINYRKVSVTIKGKGDASVSEIFILAGSTQKIEFSSEDGYYLSDVTVNGISKGNASSIDVTVDSEDVEVVAEFKKIETSDNSSESAMEYYINIIIESGKGSFSPSNSVAVSQGGSYTITFTPDDSYILPSTIKDNENIVTCEEHWDGVYTIENIGEDHTIKISFPSSENVHDESVGDDTTDEKNESNGKLGFAKKYIVVIIIIGIIFGGCCVVFAINSQKSKKKKKKKKKNGSETVHKNKK